PHYKIIMVNPTAERVFYLIPGISHGRDFRDIFKSEALFNIVEDTIEKQNFTPKFTYPTFEWNYDRMTKHFQVKVFPVEKEDGARIAYIILLEDVTKLKELDQMKSDFISIASHELRTPLTSILMSIAMVLEGSAGPLTPDQKELLAAANEDGVRMRYMMNNLLDISRIETGRMEMEFFPVSPDSLLISVVNSFNAQAQAKKIELVADIEKELPNVYADYNRIMQVLNNLVSNALRYTPEGGKITLGAARGEDGLIEFRVEDTGSGIPRDYLKKVFRKFVQVESDPKRGGAGLGLALSLEIIRAHHGTLWVESELGKGSQFYFTLPVAKEENGEDEIAI
ncbi:MAG: ATP-binding protein, partial [Vulcanimicrobiota bacterium]